MSEKNRPKRIHLPKKTDENGPKLIFGSSKTDPDAEKKRTEMDLDAEWKPAENERKRISCSSKTDLNAGKDQTKTERDARKNGRNRMKTDKNRQERTKIES